MRRRNSLGLLISVLACAQGSSSEPSNGDASVPSDGARDGQIVTEPGDQRDLLGVYAWGMDPVALPGTGSILERAAQKLRQTTTRTIRVAMDPSDPYGINPSTGTFSLANTATSAGYRPLFSDGSFRTIYITAYSAADYAHPWGDGMTAEETATVQADHRALTATLLREYPGKTFVLINWEGDNALKAFPNSPTAWTGYRDWVRARGEGVTAGRADAPDSTATVLFGIEGNLVRDLQSRMPCGTANVRCVFSDIMPVVRADIYSYSSWQSLDVDLDIDPAMLTIQYNADLARALALVQTGQPQVTKDNFVVGEFGQPRDSPWGECKSARNLNALLRAVMMFRPRNAIFWQLADNRATDTDGPSSYGFGLLSAYVSPTVPAGRATLLHTALTSFLADGMIHEPAVRECPEISRGGVTGSEITSRRIVRNGTVEIYGSFPATGNTVVFRRTTMISRVTSESPFWFESATQINATIPTDVLEGAALGVSVVARDGTESNIQWITVNAP